MSINFPEGGAVPPPFAVWLRLLYLQNFGFDLRPCILACEKRDQSRAGQNPGDHNLPRPPTNATAVVSCNEVVKRFCAGSVRLSVCLCVGRPTLNAADVSG